MLALFKESAMKFMDKPHGALVPFNVFYDALHQFLDHSHKGVILRAADNSYINPDKEEDCFNVNVLKALFMIKYVDWVPANVENITSLMIADIDTDRIELKKLVEEALQVLVRQMLVQKNGEIYVFLTNEEQEINREIENIDVETNEVISKVSEIIFEDIYSEKKYRYPEHHGRYNFAFNQFVDDIPHKSNQNNDVGVRILTPGSEHSEDETTLRMMSGQANEVLVVLPDDSTFLNELRRALKIEKYLRLTTANGLAKFNQIKSAKTDEMRERNENARLFLQESMKNAIIYVNGERAETGTSDATARINEALGRLVATVYHKLSYINVAMDEANIKALFESTNLQSLDLEGGGEANAHAVHDVLDFITKNTDMHTQTSMKSIMNRFMKAPYGFIEDDVKWIVAKLFKNGDISFTVSGAAVTLLNKSAEEIISYITKRGYVEKLLTERRLKASPEEKEAVREVIKELFGFSSAREDDDSMMQSFQSYSSSLVDELEKTETAYENFAYPGKKVVTSGKNLLRSITQIQSPGEFYKKIFDDKDRYLDFAEDYEPVKTFFSGKQKKIFENALKLMRIYDDSKTYIVDKKVEETVREIRAILKKDMPYSQIPELPSLLDKFRNAYMAVLNKTKKPVLEAIEDAKVRVFKVLNNKSYKDELEDRYLKLFEELNQKAETQNNVATLQSVKIEADALKVRLLNEMTDKDLKLAEETGAYDDSAIEPKQPVKKKKSMSIKNVSPSSTWQIESAEDLDKYINDLREQILKELSQDTILNIEF